jgi:hypothetical protein
MTTSVDHFNEELFLFGDIDSGALQDNPIRHSYADLFLGALTAVAVSAGGWALILAAMVRLAR